MILRLDVDIELHDVSPAPPHSANKPTLNEPMRNSNQNKKIKAIAVIYSDQESETACGCSEKSYRSYRQKSNGAFSLTAFLS